MSNCYKVEVETTGGYPANKADHAEGGYLDVQDGTVYILAGNMSDIEEIVKADKIISIERVGVGYVHEAQLKP